MRYSTYRFSLDLHKHQSQMSIAVFQYDTACRLCISLTDGGVPYLIEDGCTAVLYGRRADNTPIAHNCMIEGNARIVYDFQDSTAAVQDIVDCQIRLYGKDGDLITAPRFIIVVEERAVREYEIELKDDTLSAIDKIFTEENARVAAEIARDEAENGKKDETGERITDGRVQAEQKRVTAENKRFYAELDRVEAEQNRADEEQSRQASEAERMEAEQSRASAETTRALDEFDRRRDETQRKNQENGRVTSENARVEAENARANAETARVAADLSREERTNNALASLSKVYRLGGVANTLADLPSNPEVGIVYSVESDFKLNGLNYTAGTNVVYTENGWDALGGILDQSLVAQWDLIITDPDDLKNKLPYASGNVLVKIDGNFYEDFSLKLTLGYGLKLLDFGHTVIDGVDEITANKYSYTVIRNLRADNFCTLKNFAVVENCKGYIDADSCQEVRGGTIHTATSCTNVHDCVSDIVAPYSVSFTSCDLINNITITSIETAVGEEYGTVEFVNCHHISNVHCAEGAENAVRIHYDNCTFVDPFTCAGYVQPEDSGKVPVPDSAGGVEFKEFVPALTPDDTFLSAIVLSKTGAYETRRMSKSSTADGMLPQRTPNGQIVAPNQTKNIPELDHYISRRYFEANAPSGGDGSKLYRHRISIMNYQGGTWCYDISFIVYSHSATPYENCAALPFNGYQSIPAEGYFDPYDTGEEMYPVTAYIHPSTGYNTPALRYFSANLGNWVFDGEKEYYIRQTCYDWVIDEGEGEEYQFNDTVTEVT